MYFSKIANKLLYGLFENNKPVYLGTKHQRCVGTYCIHLFSSSSSAHEILWESCVKFGTQIQDSLNINQSKFGVFNSNSLAPPTGQTSTHVSECNLEFSKIYFYFF